MEEISAELQVKEGIENYVQRKDILAVLLTVPGICSVQKGSQEATCFTSCQNAACSYEFLL